MKYTIATLASHSALQILKGGKDEGFQTLAVATAKTTSFYRRFRFIDSIMQIDSFSDFFSMQNKLQKVNAIIIPHGSFVAYLGSDFDKKLTLMHYGNKKILNWEGDRLKQRLWLEKSGIKVPAIYHYPKSIDKPVIVKLYGAKGGSGYFLAKNEKEFNQKIKSFAAQKYIIQEYIIGVPVYLQFFYSAVRKEVELLGIDRRYESNVDGIGRLPSSDQTDLNIEPTYTVIGNFPIALRESLLPEAYRMAESAVKESQKSIPPKGLYGPFCLETIVTPTLDFFTIEISCRIVAGTNIFDQGSPYSDYHFNEPMSCGRRIAREIKEAIELNKLNDILG